MAIPSAPDLMLPVLAAHDDGAQLRLEEILTRVASAVDVSEDGLAQRQPSGDLVFAQRIGWARNYLEQRGLIDRPTRGESRITDAGREALASGEPIVPPAAGGHGTAKTTLAQAVAEAARDADKCNGYVLTTATADWTTRRSAVFVRPGLTRLTSKRGISSRRSERTIGS